MTRIFVLLISITVIGIIGCQMGGKQPSDASTVNHKTNESESGAVSTDMKDNLPSVIERQEAWKDQSIRSFDAVLPNQKAWIPLALGSDGTIVGVVTPQDKDLSGQVILFDVNKQAYKTIYSFREPAQPIGADINDNWIVWSEALDQSFTNWKIHVYDRVKNTKRVIYESAKDTNGMGYPGPLIMPKLYENWLVFSPAVDQPKNGIPSIVVKKLDLRTGESSDIASPGGHPVMTKDFIAWIGKDSEQASGAVYWNKGGHIEQLTHKQEVTYLAAEGSTIAWSGHRTGEGGWSVNLIENGVERKIFSAKQGNSLEFLGLSPRILAWQSREDVQVYDRKLNKVVTLEKNVNPSSVIAKDQLLLWSTPIPKTMEERAAVTSRKGILPHTLHLIQFSD
ncbi:hypothetical protein [Effusibacillus pohliae]|uniref:hypothetical protein n=1 Tax=Effusibacillus pohliae TaxID=232270 RepID=UPI0012E9E7C5|nr:hypothetical protein [Effusibacillus pohliae]